MDGRRDLDSYLISTTVNQRKDWLFEVGYAYNLWNYRILIISL